MMNESLSDVAWRPNVGVEIVLCIWPSHLVAKFQVIPAMVAVVQVLVVVAVLIVAVVIAVVLVVVVVEPWVIVVVVVIVFVADTI